MAISTQQDYIHAMLELIQEGTDVTKVLAGLKKTLQARGHEKLERGILDGVCRILETKSITGVPKVTVANTADIHSMQQHIRSALNALELDSEVSTVTLSDPNIVGGVTVEYNHTFVDMSYRSRLRSLYESIT